MLTIEEENKELRIIIVDCLVDMLIIETDHLYNILKSVAGDKHYEKLVKPDHKLLLDIKTLYGVKQ